MRCAIKCNAPQFRSRPILPRERNAIHTLRYAKSSVGELRTQTYIAIKLGELTPTVGEPFVQELRELGAMIQSLIFALEKSEH